MKQQRGFTLVELAISMVILGLVLTGFALALSQQVQQRQLTDTRTALQQANDAIVAFVIANARLPCPAVAGSNGQESMAGIGRCTAAAGFLPAVSLGLPNLDGNGLLNDGWADGSTHDNAGVLDYPRAIRYSVALLAGTAQPTRSPPHRSAERPARPSGQHSPPTMACSYAVHRPASWPPAIAAAAMRMRWA